MRTACAHNMANNSKFNVLPNLVPYSIFGWFHSCEETGSNNMHCYTTTTTMTCTLFIRIDAKLESKAMM